MKNIVFLLSAVLVALGLQACSPHPGAGHWQAQDGSNSRFELITVEFDGKADLKPSDEKAENQRCFWSGKDAQTIQLQCTQGDDSGLEFLYLLSVDTSGSEPVATLSLDAKPIGVYQQRQEAQQ
jgi:hypothetical protein